MNMTGLELSFTKFNSFSFSTIIFFEKLSDCLKFFKKRYSAKIFPIFSHIIFIILFFSPSFRVGKAFVRFEKLILLDLKKGPRNLKILPDNIEEYFKPKNLKIKNKKIISQINIKIPTYKKNNLPVSLQKIPITRPGSRFLK